MSETGSTSGPTGIPPSDHVAHRRDSSPVPNDAPPSLQEVQNSISASRQINARLESIKTNASASEGVLNIMNVTTAHSPVATAVTLLSNPVGVAIAIALEELTQNELVSISGFSLKSLYPTLS